MNVFEASTESLLKSRSGGAFNIKGILYQMRYSLLRSIELLLDAEGTESVRLEGIEDFDRLGFDHIAEYTQVKSSIHPWRLHQMGGVFASFIVAMRANPSSSFRFVIDSGIGTNMMAIAKYNDSSADIKLRTRQAVSRCIKPPKSLGANWSKATDAEIDTLLTRLTVDCLSESRLLASLNGKLVEHFNVHPNSAEVYGEALCGRFLALAKDRSDIDKAQWLSIFDSIQERLALVDTYEAAARGLVTGLDLSQEGNQEDYFDARRTDATHIHAGLDVPREKWLTAIKRSFDRTKVVCIRSSSGQGKSSLMYRYAISHFSNLDNVFRVVSVETAEQAATIAKYLKLKAVVYGPLLILIDGVNIRTSQWAFLANELANSPIHILLTIRSEDFERYGSQDGLDISFIEPRLDLNEARSLFKSLKSRGRIASTIRSADKAYEDAGPNPLLLEYVYYITRGQMLADRLANQVRSMHSLHEDPAKLQLLRLVAFAHINDVSLPIAKVRASIPFRDDFQMVLAELQDEYIITADEKVQGINHVRSAHLVTLLHPTENELLFTLRTFVQHYRPE